MVETLGIYEVDGDRLRLRFAQVLPEVKTQQRPRQFALEPGSGDILLDLRRDRLSDDEKTMREVEWNVVSLLDDGKPTPTENLKPLYAVCKDYGFGIVIRERGQMFFGPMVLDAAKRPKTITMKVHGYLYGKPTIQERSQHPCQG